MNLRRRRGFLIVNGLGCLIWFFAVAFYQKQILSLRYEISELEEKAQIEDVIRRDLCVEIARLKNPERIEKVGEKLGFIKAGLSQTTILSEVKFAPEEKIEEKTKSSSMLAFIFGQKAEAKTVGSEQ